MAGKHSAFKEGEGAARLSVSMGGGTDRIIGFIEGRGRGQEY